MWSILCISQGWQSFSGVVSPAFILGCGLLYRRQYLRLDLEVSRWDSLVGDSVNDFSSENGSLKFRPPPTTTIFLSWSSLLFAPSLSSLLTKNFLDLSARMQGDSIFLRECRVSDCGRPYSFWSILYSLKQHLWGSFVLGLLSAAAFCCMRSRSYLILSRMMGEYCSIWVASSCSLLTYLCTYWDSLDVCEVLANLWGEQSNGVLVCENEVCTIVLRSSTRQSSEQRPSEDRLSLISGVKLETLTGISLTWRTALPVNTSCCSIINKIIDTARIAMHNNLTVQSK